MKRYKLNLELSAVIISIAVGVLLPVMLSAAVGIVALVLAEKPGDIVMGALILCFAVAAAGSAVATVVLAGRKIRLARRQADFVANVSHELRTPLSAIKLHAQTLQSDVVAENALRRRQCIDVILREIEWLDVMIERVLAWRASSHNVFDTLTTQTVKSAVQGAVDRFCSMIAPDEVDFRFECITRCPVRHNANALNLALLNLLTNAYKYTGRDKEISVRVRDEEDWVVIDIEDNGIGLSPTEAKRVFEPFYRAPNPQTQHTGGAGLGLSITRRLVKAYRGAISVQSQKGEGTCISIRLPAQMEET